MAQPCFSRRSLVNITRQKWKLPSKVVAVGNFGGVRPAKPLQIRWAWTALMLAPTMARTPARVLNHRLPSVLMPLA